MARTRDGSNQLVFLAKGLLSIVIAWQTIIRQRYGSSPAVINLLEAILALAPLLAQAEPVLVAYNGDNDDIVQDPSSTAGIDPYAPAAPVPDA